MQDCKHNKAPVESNLKLDAAQQNSVGMHKILEILGNALCLY